MIEVHNEVPQAKIKGSYVWRVHYDGLGRRIQTDYIPAGANTVTIASNRIRTWFDPQVEFMTIAVEHHGKREWMVRGPDMDADYGSFQGLGGLEAIIDEATGKTTPIIDTVHGHVVATIDLGDPANTADDVIRYKEQQFGGYGPLPGSVRQQPLEVTEDLATSLGWQTRCIDPTGFFAMGARHYDPLSGRFLSADPFGHGATPDLYSYAGGDPVNFIDPTGRNAITEFGAAVYDEYIGIGERILDSSAEIGYTLADMYIWSSELRETGEIDVSREPFSQTFRDNSRETVTFAGLGIGPEFDVGVVFATTEVTASVGTLGAYNAVSGGIELAQGNYEAAQDQFVTSLLVSAGGVRSTEVIRRPSRATADQAMVDRLVAQRSAAARSGRETGDATYATGSNARGSTGVYESVPGRVHAEPQALNNLRGGSQQTIAVDQIPCSSCQSQMSNGTRVVVPENPLKPGGSPKSAARNAALQGGDVQPRVLPRDARGYAVDPTGKYTKP